MIDKRYTVTEDDRTKLIEKLKDVRRHGDFSEQPWVGKDIGWVIAELECLDATITPEPIADVVERIADAIEGEFGFVRGSNSSVRQQCMGIAKVIAPVVEVEVDRRMKEIKDAHN